MAEIPTNDYLHRSIDQLRSMNERGVLSSLSHLTTADLRTATLVHEYKPFNINEFRQNVERLDYIKNGLMERNGQHQQQVVNATDSSARQDHDQQQQQQQQQQVQQIEMKQSYSAPSSPATPLSDGQETKYNPKSEMLAARDTKPYKCSQCPKTFANSSYLSQHTRIHLGIKPYRCEICQRKFTQLSHLQQHIRTHTGDKPYKCRHQGCQKAFSQLSNLQSHSRCHQTDKPFKCNSCYKCFTDEVTLLEHIPKHKDSKHLKTHICSFCGKSYTQETYLQKHLQKHAEKAEKQQSRNSTSNGTTLAAGLGLNINRNIVMNVAAVAAAANSEHPYWPKVSPDSAAATLAEAIQQQQQQQQQHQQQQEQQQQQQQQTNGFDFTLTPQLQNELQNHHRVLLGHHRAIVNGGVGGSGGGSGGSSAGNAQSGNDDGGEDLVITRQTQHTQQQQQPQQQSSSNTIVVVSSYDGGAKTVANSAFTPINTITPHLNALTHHAAVQRPYIYDALQFQTATTKTTGGGPINQNIGGNPVNAFPNQLISLHQIRNYAHQPGTAAGILAAGDHLLSIGIPAGGKEKGQ